MILGLCRNSPIIDQLSWTAIIYSLPPPHTPSSHLQSSLREAYLFLTWRAPDLPHVMHFDRGFLYFDNDKLYEGAITSALVVYETKES
jgi:hypothetical protein